MGLGELVDLVDLVLAAEETVRLLAAEWPQTGTGRLAVNVEARDRFITASPWYIFTE